MQSEMLRKARLYEEENRPKAADSLPVYHLTGGIGWINDPNGFSSYRGEAHCFFQYYPYRTLWGPMHWGHAKTDDFVRWEFLPAAMAPDAAFDRDGCFSGSAVELPDGRQFLLYTGVIRETQEDGSITETQTQCAAIGDGIDYEKAALNPVIGFDDLPEGGSRRDFRDPKIWRESDRYYAVVANRTADNSGAILLYESEDALHWHYVSTLAACRNRYGTMWECPDLFLLDGKAVLLHSAHEMLAQEREFHPGNGTVCHIGNLDRENRQFHDEQIQAIDYGLDFYASQTMLSEDGRRIMIAWMQSWESASFPAAEMKFFGQMTLPRELGIRNGRLIQNPVREIERYRRNAVTLRDVPIREETSLPGICGRVLDMTADIRPLPGGQWKLFEIKVAKNEKYSTKLSLIPGEGIIRLDRTNSGYAHDVVHVREFPVRFPDGTVRLRLLMDRYSMEVFVNDGEQAASMTFYTPAEADAITFSSDAPALVSVEKYDISVEDRSV